MTLCYLELRLSLLLFSLLRSLLTLSGTIYLSLLSTTNLLSTLNLLDQNSLYVLILILSTFFLTEVIFMVAICQRSRPWLVPWLVVNFLLLISLLGAVLYNVVTIILPMILAVDNLSMEKVQNLISGGDLFVMGQFWNFSAAIHLFLDMRFKRRVSFSKKVLEKKMSRVDMEEYESKDAYSDFTNLPLNEKSQKFTEDLERSKERKREMRLSMSSNCSEKEDFVMFSLDDEDNFA